MEIEIQLTKAPIAEKISPGLESGAHGAWLEFRGIVRADENGQKITALEYEAYLEMAEREIRRILESLAAQHPCLAVKVIHRLGVIPIGEPAIYVGVASAHRGEALRLVTEFMNRLKQDVPIWKARASSGARLGPGAIKPLPSPGKPLSLDDALAQIRSRVQPLPPVRTSLNEALNRVLRESIQTPEDCPACDRSTRDGYAILQSDSSQLFRVVDTLHAADWKPRQMSVGEAVRVATGTAMPCENARVVMQEDVERVGDQIKIIRRDSTANVRQRGEEMRAGQTILPAGTSLNAGALALLATFGCTQPLVSPSLRAVHFTTGDELVPPDQVPKSGQVRDCNSILIRSLLKTFPCEVVQSHLPEDFAAAKTQVESYRSQIESAHLLLISGGASVGDRDFTRELLVYLGFDIVFRRLNIRPGAPLIFGMNGHRLAFGLPGNPVSHLVCFRIIVAAALRDLTGACPQPFLPGPLVSPLDDESNPRETFLPAHLDAAGLHLLRWMSSGDVTCLAEANALVRVPPNRGRLAAGTKVEFLPI